MSPADASEGTPAQAPTIAVVGGGQLARMMAEPAAALGLPLRLLAEAPGVSAAQVIPDHEVGDYRDLDALRRLVEGCRVVTFDHEHVPTEHLHALEEAGIAVHPGPAALVHAQDKVVMREALAVLDAPMPRWAVVTDLDEVVAFGLPCVLKTSRGGYDGRGVWFVHTPEEAAPALEAVAATGAGPVLVSGSGPTVFGLYEDTERARAAAAEVGGVFAEPVDAGFGAVREA